MRRFTGTLANSAGVPQPGAQVQVFVSGTNALASLFSPTGSGISNPLTTDQNGQYSFNVLSGVYDIADASGNLLLQQVQIFDFKNPAEWLGVWTFPGSGFKVGAATISNPSDSVVQTSGPLAAVTSLTLVATDFSTKRFRLFNQSGDPFPAVQIDENDALAFGTGILAPDVNLYRSSSAGLATDAELFVGVAIGAGFVTGSIDALFHARGAGPHFKAEAPSGNMEYQLVNTGQVAPAGRFRLRLNGDQLSIDRSTSGDFATTKSPFSIAGTAPDNSLQISATATLMTTSLQHTGSAVGFYASTPITKQTVTGSRGANAALASLLAALNSLGLITDSST